MGLLEGLLVPSWHGGELLILITVHLTSIFIAKNLVFLNDCRSFIKVLEFSKVSVACGMILLGLVKWIVPLWRLGLELNVLLHFWHLAFVLHLLLVGHLFALGFFCVLVVSIIGEIAHLLSSLVCFENEFVLNLV